ncbi:alanyl-tRNA editing protein [Thermoplasmatales archaeon SW_10_69_26]|nr:MAG: alanyl-tRNA editing protein [Thermoplasmatales archaeon SW_10_69_26]
MADTDLLYLPDPERAYEKTFEAEVVEASDDHLKLDRTLFYPTGGGQPHDEGTIEVDGRQLSVTDVRKDHGDPLHEVTGEVPAEGTPVTGEIDWTRRHQLMRMHTAQHVLSAVVYDEWDAVTKGNQIHTDYSRVDFDVDEVTEDELERIENACNEVFDDDIPVEGYEEERSRLKKRIDTERTLLHLIPDHITTLRVVEIGDVDITPCAGTHVERTGEIGEMRILRTENKGSGRTRIVYDLQEP